MYRNYAKRNRSKLQRSRPRLIEIKPAIDGSLKRIFASIGTPENRKFKPDPFQLKALAAIKESDCLVTAPTGAGKTWIAEQAIAQIFSNSGRSWYASPLKALSNSKFAEFSTIFGAEHVGILTGDRKENPEAPIIIGTTEILRNQLYDSMHRGETLATDFVILDEAHFLGDEDRGVVWEEVMIYLPQRIPLLMLSATIGNAHEIADWLSSVRSKKCQVVQETKRPVPLFPLFLHPSGRLLPLMSADRPTDKKRISKKVGIYLKSKHPPLMASPRKLPPFGDILQVLKKYRLLPAIFFLKSRADCDQAIGRCAKNLLDDTDRKALLRQRIESLLHKNTHIYRHRQRWQLENYAVGSHHSGQLPAWKIVLETLMTEGLLDAVFATSTVAAGVNYPARTIVLMNSDRFNGSEFLPLTPTEFHQMTGRAGRRGMDRIGFAVAIPGKFMDIRLVANLIMSSSSQVTSQIKINFSMVLNLLLSHSIEQIENLLEKSLATYQLVNRKEKKAPPSLLKYGQRYLWQDFMRHLNFLVEKGYVSENGVLSADGIWASRLRIDHPLLLAEGFRLGILPESDPALLAAIIGSFVNEREPDEKIARKFISKKLLKSFLKVKRGLTPFVEQMEVHGFAVEPLFLRPALTMYAWASGYSWENVLALSEIEEGDLAMLILRSADNLRHIMAIAPAFPEAAETAAKAIELILRDPVVMDYNT